MDIVKTTLKKLGGKLNIENSKGVVLDAGGGTGKWARIFAQKGYEVIVTDLSSQMLKQGEKYAKEKGLLSEEEEKARLQDMRHLPEAMRAILEKENEIKEWASVFAQKNNALFLGRGMHYPIALEGALKLKEISYIHSEAYAAGELKHGTISLIEDGVLVVAVATQPELFEKEVSNMVEVRSRGASLFGLTTYGQYAIEDTVNFTVYVPRTDPLLATSLAVVPLQLLAYYISCAKGLDVDKPRNLAKSVTVE